MQFDFGFFPPARNYDKIKIVERWINNEMERKKDESLYFYYFHFYVVFLWRNFQKKQRVYYKNNLRNYGNN